jgi:5-(carboxyamino)imidazole ribonucleotide synthase
MNQSTTQDHQTQPVLAVIGGGQLGRMTAEAAAPLGLRCRFLDDKPNSPAFAVGESIDASFTDTAALEHLAANASAVTVEFENVPAEALRIIERVHPDVPVRPCVASLETSQDRLAEKTLFSKLGIPTAPFIPIATKADAHEAAERLGLPMVIKARRFGYDGKGQFVIEHAGQLDEQWGEIGATLASARGGTGADRPDVGAIAEAFVRFERELSATVVRSASGDVIAYPVAHNTHEGGILRLPHAPAAELPGYLADRAVSVAARTAERLGHVGALTLELFQTESELLANEFAPRVHNSAHWTIEGTVCSQFENHVRAALALPLGQPTLRPGIAACAMVNLIGDAPDRAALLRLASRVPHGSAMHTHLYGKAPRPGRKLGHVTITATSAGLIDEALALIVPALNNG